MKAEREEKLALLEQQVKRCDRCALCQSRTNTVFGKGSSSCKILFVGEAPGEHEDREGKPFVGAAGKLLDHFIDFLGLEEEEYYIANILKCRPPKNRDPLPEEEEACLPFLREQVRILKPAMLVCLGRIAAQRIISPDFRITRQHGVFFQHNGMKMMATFHPSALLRDPSKKEEALKDFKKILEELE
jgi:DNA polymerase